MKLLDAKKIGEKEIAYINELTLKGMTQRDIVKHELGDGATAVEVEGMFQRLKRNMKKSPYRLNKAKGVYEKPEEVIEQKSEQNEISETIIETENLEKEVEKEEEKIEISQQVSEENNPVETEKYKEKEKIIFTKKVLKTNPIRLENGMQILEHIYEANEGKANRKGVGAYIMKDVESEFKLIEENFDYMPAYVLMDAAIIRCNQFKQDIETSDLFADFTNLSRKDEKSSRKQTNIKFTKATIKTIDELSHYFHFLNKSEIINLCMYVMSKSAQTTFLKTEK